MTTTDTITRGDVVTYHGTIAQERGHTFYIFGVRDDGRFTIADPEYPTMMLTQVSRSSITPTGQHLTLCECGHQVVDGERCYPCGWTCPNHRADG